MKQRAGVRKRTQKAAKADMPAYPVLRTCQTVRSPLRQSDNHSGSQAATHRSGSQAAVRSRCLAVKKRTASADQSAPEGFFTDMIFL